jgi:integrase/recombinase XerD
MLNTVTLSSSYHNFLIDKQSQGKAEETITYYKLQIRYLLEWLNQNNATEDITQLTPATLRQYFLDLSTHRNKGGCHASYRAIRCFLNWATNEYDLEWKNPIAKVKVEKSHIAPLPEIPLENVQKLINCCGYGNFELRNKSIIMVLIDCGLRGRELCDLNISDIDLVTGKVMIWHGKGDKTRIVWIGEKTRKVLKDYLKTRNDTLTPTTPLFLNEHGQRLLFNGLKQVIMRLSIRANVPFQGVHAFRRTFALTLYRKTRDIFLVSRYLGHSSIEVTKRYLNLGNEDLRDIHEANSPADLLN